MSVQHNKNHKILPVEPTMSQFTF